MKYRKILYVINNINFFISHRLEIALEAAKKGYDISIVCGKEDTNNLNDLKRLKNLGIEIKYCAYQSTGLNPFRELKGLLQAYKYTKSFKPDIIHCISPKGILYGGILSLSIKIRKVVLAFSGFGFMYTQNKGEFNFIRYLLSSIYSIILKLILNQKSLIRIIVQNTDDLNTISKFQNKKNNITLIPGSGVNLRRFKNSYETKEKIVLFPARVLRDKGIFEFINASTVLSNLYPNWDFIVAGDLYSSNPSAVNISTINKWKDRTKITFLGHVKNIEEYFHRAAIVCLPSYREGMPKALLEAAAASCAIITTDTIGCREAIIPNKTGLLVKVGDSEDLKMALEELILNDEIRKKFSKNGRKLAEQKYSVEFVVKKTLDIYAS